MKQGFSLVELSIVLVILGLLTGGILGGQSLMKAAELRAVSQEVNKYNIAVNTFQDKYFAKPGDMPNATQFWTNATDGDTDQCDDPADDEGTGSQTCNGNGNSTVAEDGQGEDYESFRFWEHLANSGLIEGQYTGIAGSGGTKHAVPGENIPRSKWSNAAWGIARRDDPWPGNGQTFAGRYGHFFIVGEQTTNEQPYIDTFTPEELWNIDTKTDDGKPGRGKIMAHQWATCSDAADQNDIDADYALNVTGTACAMYVVRMYE